MSPRVPQRGAKKKPAAKKAPAAKPEPAAPDEGASSVRRDGIAFAFLAIAVVVALREWFGLSGILGGLIHRLTAGTVGLISILAPVLFTALAIKYFRASTRATNRRFTVGLGLIVVCLTGLIHIVRSPVSPLKDFAPTESAGGLLGWASGGSLSALLSPFGAVPVLLLVLLFDAVYMTDTPLRDVVAKVRERRAGRKDADSDVPNHGSSASVPYDQAAEIGEEVPKTRLLPRRRREATPPTEALDDASAGEAKPLPGIYPYLHQYVPKDCTFNTVAREDADKLLDVEHAEFEATNHWINTDEVAVSAQCNLVILMATVSHS